MSQKKAPYPEKARPSKYQLEVKEGLIALGLTGVAVSPGCVAVNYEGETLWGTGCSLAEKAGDVIARIGRIQRGK